MEYPEILISHEQVASWAGRPLTREEWLRLDEAIPHSSIPDAVGVIVASFDERD